MSMDLTELVSVLANEIVVDEELYCNVKAQQKSIVMWDIENSGFTRRQQVFLAALQSAAQVVRPVFDFLK